MTRIRDLDGNYVNLDADASDGAPAGSEITEITDLPTAETDDTLVLSPDGAGGVEFRAEVGGVTADTSYLAANVTQTTGGQWYSGPNTGSLSAGTYMLSGQLYVDCSSLGTVNEESLRIFDGSAAVGPGAAAIFQNATNQRLTIVISPFKHVIVGAKTFTIQATNTSNGATIKDTLDNNGTTDKASYISYMKI